MRYSSRTFISLLVIAGLLSGVVLVAPPAAAVSTTTWTSTADFDAVTKSETTVARNWFATNGVSQPENFINYPSAQFFGGRTYFAWQGPNAAGSARNPVPYVTYYDHASENWGDRIRVTGTGFSTDDDHGATILFINSNGTIHILFGPHTN